MKKGNITIRAWMAKATPDEKKTLAKAAKTSVMHLWHCVYGRRQIGPELAQRLAHASAAMGLPIRQVDLCAVCAHCALIK